MTTAAMVSPTAALDAAFAGAPCDVVHDDGTTQRLAVRRWRGEADDADHELFVRRCAGRTLDVGCGPGRLTAALAPSASAVLGIDVSREAIRQARVRGANVLRHNVFERLPGAGCWDHVLLADGNIGIGGDPVRMLRRAAELAGTGGRVLAELEPAANGVVRHRVRLRVHAMLTEPFAWASVGIDAIEAVAGSAGLCVEGMAHAAGRCVATLVAHAPRG